MKIKADEVMFSYPGRSALDGVTLEASPGEVTIIIGPNGSGKSTLLRCFARVLSPQEGSITVGNADISSMDKRVLAKTIGFVPQVTSEAFPITVFEAVLLGRKPHLTWTVSDTDKQKVIAALDEMGITHLAPRHTHQLSGGERQKVLIARALAQEPQTFLLDEPTANLDIRYQLEVLQIARSLAKNKMKTVIVVLHDLNMAARFADKLILLSKGSIFTAGLPDDVLTADNIESVYNVTADVLNGPHGPSIVPLCPVYHTSM